MNGRIAEAHTPEERLAAVCRTLIVRMENAARRRGANRQAAEPDYADFRDALRPYIRREIVMALLEEMQDRPDLSAAFRVAALRAELEALNRIVKKEARW
jgi:hypothetical protein